MLAELLPSEGRMIHSEAPSKPSITPERTENKESIKGKKIYVTGKIHGYNKDEIEEIVNKAGAIYASGILKSLDLLIIGDRPGPSKLEKARNWGIKTMSWEEFKKFL